MKTTPKNSRPALSSKLRRYAWPAVAVVSLVVNVGLVGGYFYLLYNNQTPLIQSQISVRCSEPGYTRFLHQMAEEMRADGTSDA